jgi:GTPase SAR1 family protein
MNKKWTDCDACEYSNSNNRTEDNCTGEKIFRNINKPNDVYKILTCTPLTPSDYYSLNNALGERNKECFYSLFFKGSNTSQKVENKLINLLKSNEKWLFCLTGHMGCGKTTFIHHFLDKSATSYASRIIDFDKSQRAIDEAKLNEIIRDSITKYYFYDTRERSTALKRLIAFFNSERFVSDVFDSDNEISLTVIDPMKKSDDDSLWKTFQYQMSKLSLCSLLTLFFITEISFQSDQMNYTKKTIIAIDNLDLVDSTNLLKEFQQAVYDVKQYLTEYYSRRESGEAMTAKFAFFLVMRGYSHALLNESSQDDLEETWTKDISLVYDRENIIKKRFDSIRNWDDCINLDDCDKKKLIFEMECVTAIHQKQRSLIELFNHNYRRTTIAIKRISEDRVTRPLYDTYLELLRANCPSGANGIFIHLLMRLFSKKNCLEKIGIVPFSEHSPEYSYSVSRQILTFLSHGICLDNNLEIEKAHSAKDLYAALLVDGGLKKEVLIDALWNMFQLKNTETQPDDLSWTNLIDFHDIKDLKLATLEADHDAYITQAFKREFQLTTESYEPQTHKYTTLLITAAGRAFVRHIAPHYEFFSYRCFFGNRTSSESYSAVGEAYKPLFCFDLANPATMGAITKITNTVFSQVGECCKGLNRQYELRGFYPTTDPKKFEKSYITYEFIRKGEERPTRELHSERIINYHIGYLEDFRKYLLGNQAYNIDLKMDYNKLLTAKIKDYCMLIEGRKTRSLSKSQRDMGIYLEKIKTIEKSDYSDFTTTIEKDSSHL